MQRLASGDAPTDPPRWGAQGARGAEGGDDGRDQYGNHPGAAPRAPGPTPLTGLASPSAFRHPNLFGSRRPDGPPTRPSACFLSRRSSS
jgi:hypothetical protein